MLTQKNTEQTRIPKQISLDPHYGIDFDYFYKDLGTTIVGLKYEGGVVLAADCRSTSGNYVANRTNDKLYPLAKNIVAAKCGGAADTQFILGTVVKYLTQFQMEFQGIIPVKVAATLVGKLTYRYKDHFSAGIIIGGVDETGPHVFSVSSGSVIEQPMTASGSGSYFISGFLDAHFQENFNKQNAIEFAKSAVSLAINKDNSSGGGVRIIDITLEGYTRHDFSFNTLPYQS
eukprot:CAMPEP_0170518316 /NCGR_PEP_ID=MMETSP0209-20121228/4031_1 /TAXON_ID=665100 ORGANISM="Litonotus pictus, Strain P1" /NCGR_SAMPLE_ID=MMETSP0209 /ASSEMBLY_ACC=CAM_ASM_000301 /LENGTH=230 /DNA_ID=CAMNT_0010803825 /DNA_START=12 /DNA_END=704 /DNA_ORIENTATION=-